MSLCNLCGVSASQRCKGCGTVAYCSRDHQKQDWKTHKYACKEFQSLKKQGQEWEGDVQAGSYAGTFRWSQKKDFTPMPAYLSTAALHGGWSGFWQTRFESREGKIVVEPSMIDGLSFPLTFLYTLREVLSANPEIKDWLYGGEKVLNVVAVGCAERAEEHILRHTNYWGEIANLMPSFQVALWLVGPEMSAVGHAATANTRLGPRMTAACFRGTMADFTAKHPDVLAQAGVKTILIGYNTGMASGDAALQSSWEKDIAWLLDCGILSFFSCANDHSDLKCEQALLAGRAKYVLPPMKNPFLAMTTLHPPGKQKTHWYCANAFVYAVQGTAEPRAATRCLKSVSVGSGHLRSVPAEAGPAGAAPSRSMPAVALSTGEKMADPPADREEGARPSPGDLVASQLEAASADDRNRQHAALRVEQLSIGEEHRREEGGGDRVVELLGSHLLPGSGSSLAPLEGEDGQETIDLYLPD